MKKGRKEEWRELLLTLRRKPKEGIEPTTTPFLSPFVSSSWSSLPLLISYPSHKIAYSPRQGSGLQLSRPLPLILSSRLKSTHLNSPPWFSFSSLQSSSYPPIPPPPPTFFSLILSLQPLDPRSLAPSSRRPTWKFHPLVIILPLPFFFLTAAVAITILHDFSCWTKETLIMLGLSESFILQIYKIAGIPSSPHPCFIFPLLCTDHHFFLSLITRLLYFLIINIILT